MIDTCTVCDGFCWCGENNFATQQLVRTFFGQIPNRCVVSSSGEDFCPHKKHLALKTDEGKKD